MALVAGGILLGGASAADAHANYVRSNPAADARLQRAPKEVRVAFSEPPDARGSEIAVLDPSGARVDSADTSASDEPNGLRVSLRDVGEGGYVVAWTVLSTVDGHRTRGSFAFAVGNAPLPELVRIPEAAPPPTALEIAARTATFAGIALLVGGALFGIAVRRTSARGELAREQLVLGLGGALLVAGAVGLLLDQGGRSPPRLTALLTLRGLAGVAVLAAAAALSHRRLRDVALGAGLVAAVTATLVSHAAAGSPREMAVDLVHVLGASAWAGGVAAMAVWLMPRAERRARGELGRAVGRFSAFALATVAVLSLTGLVQALERLVLLQDLWETPYGIGILAKSALLALALGLASLNLLRWGPRLRAGTDTARSERFLGLGVRGELLLVGGVLVATGLLTALVPPAQPSGAAFQDTRHAGGLRLELLLASTSPGQNRYVLRVRDGLAPVSDALRVAFRFTMIEHDMGENELVAEQRAPGEYVATGNVTAMFGTWRVEAIVRLPERADIRTIFEVPIGAPSGPGAVARVVQAPPYTLVVYVDPPQPVAGAPVILNVVLIDAKGDPVAGKTLRVTFSGPGSDTVTAKETSIGRYEAAVPALEAGTLTATIAIGTEAKGDYAFDVTR